ncbi:hypothetical protein ACFVKB_32170 [Rhodococcus sp. NPDC127530]
MARLEDAGLIRKAEVAGKWNEHPVEVTERGHTTHRRASAALLQTS